MFDTKWNPAHSRPVLLSVPAAVPSQKTVDRVTSLYYMMIGTLATITQTSIKDLLDILSERKDLYRHALKHHIKEAFSRSEQLIKVFKKHTSAIGQYQLWLDITDSMEEDLKQDVQKLFYTTDNILLKHNVPEHRIQSLTVVAYNLTVMLHDLSMRYDEVMGNLGFSAGGIKPSRMFLSPMCGMYASMREVAAIIITDRDASYFKEGGQICKALEVLALKVCDIDRIEDSANEALKLNGVDFDEENSNDNAFTPWNETQDAVLRRNFQDTPISELAKILGRSEGAVKARMRRLGIKPTAK